MSPKKPYQKRLPTVLPPAPRRAPAQEVVRPRPAPPRARRTPLAATPPASAPETAPAETPTPDPTPGPVRTPEPEVASPVAAPVAQPAPQPATVVPPPQDPAPQRSEPRTRRTLALVAAALVGVLAGGVVAWQVVGTDDSSPSPAASLPIDGWPIAGESRAVTEVLPGGDLEVTHWIHAERPLDELELTLPDLEGARVTANQVEVTADGQRAPGPGVVMPSGATYAFSEATRIQVRYRMSGAVQLSSSADGRGLASTTSLDVTATQARDVRVVRSEQVLSLACAAPDEQPVPCGSSDDDDQWRVELDETDVGNRVLAVVTVPS